MISGKILKSGECACGISLSFSGGAGFIKLLIVRSLTRFVV